MQSVTFSKDGNLEYGAMRKKSVSQSGGNFSSHGSHLAATQSTITSQTLSTADTLNRTPLSVGDIAYYRQRQQNRVFEAVWLEFVNQVETSGLTKKTIADRLGKSPSQITRWLSGPTNWTLDTVSDLLLAMKCEITIGISSLQNRPMPNFVHPSANVVGTWISTTGQQAPINFGINNTTTSLTPFGETHGAAMSVNNSENR